MATSADPFKSACERRKMERASLPMSPDKGEHKRRTSNSRPSGILPALSALVLAQQMPQEVNKLEDRIVASVAAKDE